MSFIFSNIYLTYSGWVRNLIFILIIVLYDLTCRNYVINEANHFLEKNENFGGNPSFGYFIFILFLLESVAVFIGIRRLKYLRYENSIEGINSSGFIFGLNKFIFGFANFFRLIYAIFVYLVVINSTGNYALGGFMMIFVLVREGFFIMKFFGIIYNEESELSPCLDLTNLQKRFVNITLTVTSVIFYNIGWDVLVLQMSVIPSEFLMFAIFFYFTMALLIYLPTRLYFTLEDYYSIKDARGRKNAFFSTLGIILLTVLAAIF